MIVNRKSWHFKYNAYLYGRYQTERINNGCEYFWKTVLACILSPLMGAIELASLIHERMPAFPEINMPTISRETEKRIGNLIISFGLVAIVAAITIPSIYGYGWYVLIALGFFGAVIGVIFGTIFAIITVQDYFENHPRKEKPKKEKKPNMTWQMVKAKKAKYCPTLVIND